LYLWGCCAAVSATLGLFSTTCPEQVAFDLNEGEIETARGLAVLIHGTRQIDLICRLADCLLLMPKRVSEMNVVVLTKGFFHVIVYLRLFSIKATCVHAD
jgi:hypothetical protein